MINVIIVLAILFLTYILSRLIPLKGDFDKFVVMHYGDEITDKNISEIRHARKVMTFFVFLLIASLITTLYIIN